MAQLIKLQDYVSRYEKNMIRYPSQFVRLKKQQWSKLKAQWEGGALFIDEEEAQQIKDEIEGRNGLFRRIKSLWTRDEKLTQVDQEEEKSNVDAKDSPLLFEPKVHYRPDSLEDLKHLYLDQLFGLQLIWASSTLTEISYVDMKYRREEPLRFFLQRFPDTYLIMYEPVLLIKKAPIELDVLIFTPSSLYCIKILEEADHAAYIGSSDRFWTVKAGQQEKRLLNPSISLDRSETILKQLFKQNGVSFPIKKVILSRNGYLDFKDVPNGLQLIDKRNFQVWFNQQRTTTSPLKNMQLKAVQAIFEHTETTSVSRTQWVAEDDSLTRTSEFRQ
ncbi:nuclease-related domain-containing protein [Jeotgalibacillus proteolyticus]|uniref:NERD domain-containing protein n=1 Tax=Jeotgalibacillus proteolyticus TaxID=2082395 RepID=A0A2S5GFC7_9BACL|nr:nuclease-related domain-containing protein [Jeotgalibacillus proteolyticus]PPA71689.1 NERD domain-containing protein [Jeotgalibacillus proteolyticus]